MFSAFVSSQESSLLAEKWTSPPPARERLPNFLQPFTGWQLGGGQLEQEETETTEAWFSVSSVFLFCSNVFFTVLARMMH